MVKKLLCALIVAAACVTAAVCALKSPLRRVYSDVPEKLSKSVCYYIEIQRDDTTGTDYLILLDGKGNPISMCRRDDASGNPYTASAIASK